MKPVTWILAALTLLPMGVGAQGQPGDFRRAAEFRRVSEGLVDGKVTWWDWNEASSEVWYTVREATGSTFWVMTTEGKKSPAFDVAAIAKVLPPDTQILRAQPGASPNQVLLLTNKGLFSWDRVAKTLSPSQAGDGRLTKGPVGNRSSGTGPQTNVVFRNDLTEEVEIFWVTEEGERFSYGKLAPGAVRTQNSYSGHTWLVVAAGGREVGTFTARVDRTLAVIDRSPIATPPAPPAEDPARVVRVKDFNLTLGGQPLTTDGTREDFYSGQVWWSPGRRFLAAEQVIPGEGRRITIVRSSPANQLQPTVMQIPYDKPGDRLPNRRIRIIDTQTRQVIRPDEKIFANAFDTDGLLWINPSTFTFRVNARGHQRVEVFAINTEGEVRTVVRETSPTFIDWTKRSDILFGPDGTEALWTTERNGWAQILLLDVATGAVKKEVTPARFVVREIERVDWVKKEVFFSQSGLDPKQDPVHTHLAKANWQTGGVVAITQADGNHTWRFSPDRRFVLAQYSRVDLAPVWEMREVATGRKVATLSEASFARLEARGWRKPERFVAKGRDGKTDIWGVIWRPVTIKQGQKLPIIENVYAGPHGSHVPKDFNAWSQNNDLAELGFVVVQADGMGTNFRGKTFHDVAWKNLADAGFPDRIAWIKAAAAKYPELDLARVGIFGTSAGGQTALGALLLHGDFYKAAVSDCGCHDNRMDKVWWNEQWMGYPVGPHYAEQSNVTLAPRLQGKLLLMVGEVDTNVDPASTYQVANALIQADKDFDYIVAPNVGHGVLGTRYGRRKLEDFFLLHLAGVVAKRS